MDSIARGLASYWGSTIAVNFVTVSYTSPSFPPSPLSLSIFAPLSLPPFPTSNSPRLLQQPRQFRLLSLQIRVAANMLLRDVYIGYRSLATDFFEGILEVGAVVCHRMGSVDILRA